MLGGGARREAGHEEGELELEDGQALGGDGGSPDAGGHELLDPDSLTYIVSDALLLRVFLLLSPCGWIGLDG